MAERHTSKHPWMTSSRCLTSRTVSLYNTRLDWRALALRQQRMVHVATEKVFRLLFSFGTGKFCRSGYY
jgi:hypothetical protein